MTSKTVNCIAMADILKSRRQWRVACLQRPHGLHLAITDATQANWEDFVDSIRECVEAMKEDPSLNKSHSTALYGMTGMIPDKKFLRQFVCMHQSAMLDTIPENE